MKNKFIKSIKGFTLIELLAVIIILAVIALIATPVVLNVVNNAKESARKSSVAGYADTVRLALVEKEFETKNNPSIDGTFLNGLSYQGEKVSCSEVINSKNYGVVLNECNVGIDTNLYCFAIGKVSSCSDNEYKSIYEAVKEPYKDASGANTPELINGLIPVVYNTETNKWKYADIYSNWYDYNNKEWANVVVLVSNPSTTYSVGEDISMDDISQMYVWIPRYKYIIFNGNNGSVAAQEINIVFESGTSSTGTVTCTDEVGGSGDSSETCTDTTNGNVIDGTSAYTHPAFTFGSTELTGFWVGKFETSNITSCAATNNSIGTGCDLTTLGIQIKPNVTSWRGARVSTIYTAISTLATEYGIGVDSHMMKNMEWGAVAYLTASKYGRGTTNIGINNNSSYKTGCGDTSGSDASSDCNAYETSIGMLASTTGNIYGVYDMSGGASEYVMGDLTYDGTTMMSGYNATSNSGFTGILYDSGNYTSYSGVSLPASKYYDTYTYGTSNITQSRGKLGDATKETLEIYGNTAGGWYSDYSFFIYSSYPWFSRGGTYSNGVNAGIFYSTRMYGNAITSTGRVVLTEID